MPSVATPSSPDRTAAAPAIDAPRAGLSPAPGEGKPMHVCLVSQEYPPETAHGGIGSQTYVKAHGLCALGHRVDVISRSVDDKAHSAIDGRLRVTRIPGLEHTFPIHTTEADWLTYSMAVAGKIAELHARDPFDLIDFPEWGCEGYVHLLNQTQWNHIPTLLHLHGPLVMFAHAIGWPEVDSEFYRVGTSMEGACVRRADRVFSSSRCSAEWCARHYGLALDAVPVLHMGIDTGLFHPRNVPRSADPSVVFVGNIAENKGVHLLAGAAIDVAPRFPGLKVKFIGKGNASLMARLSAEAKAAGFPDLIEFVGFVAREQLPDHLSRADLMAAPSCYEGGPGFVYLEAMACGIPVIGCSGSGSAEVVADGVNGLLVPPNDRAALAGALARLLSDRAHCRAMGAAGLQYIRQEADSRVCVARLEALYKSVVGARGAGQGESHA